MYLNYKDAFKGVIGENTGGLTGSRKVKHKDNGEYYQLKPSILDNTIKRRMKALDTDRENYGEVIASSIGRAVVNHLDYEAIPEVALVYDEERKRTPIASKYLKGTQVRTLDVYIDEISGRNTFTPAPRRHVKFTQGEANINEREYNISGEKNASLRQEIARGIAVSMIIGDHDVNPGNFIVTQNNEGVEHVARIDLGHAFNDFINAPKQFGGRLRNKDNRVLDFLNREKVANIKRGAKATLWRDFPGLIPSQEMADALKELSNPDRSQSLVAGVNRSREEFESLYKDMSKNKDFKGMAHLEKSLKAIYKNINNKNLDSSLQGGVVIKKTFEAIEKFTLENQQQMQYSAKLMQLQVNIDKYIQLPANHVERGKAKENIIQSYEELKKEYNKLGHTHLGLEWVKTDPKKRAYKGDLVSYVQQRKQQLGLVQAISTEASIKVEKSAQSSGSKRDLSIASFMTALDSLEKKAKEYRVDIRDSQGKNRIEEVKELVNQSKDKMTSDVTTKIKEKVYAIHATVTNAITNLQQKNNKTFKS